MFGNQKLNTLHIMKHEIFARIQDIMAINVRIQIKYEALRDTQHETKETTNLHS